MSIKVTQKQIKNSYNNIFSVGYCGAQFLLRGLDPVFYNSGVYGWNCDYYLLVDENNNPVIICTGYRPHGRNANGKTTELEKQANAIYNNYTLEYNEKMRLLRSLRAEWIKKLLEE